MSSIWATAIIEPNRDFEADLRLKHDGFRTVLLAYRKRRKRHDRPGWRRMPEFVACPIFPGYLFVQLQADQPWPKRNGCGFLEFVSASRKPLMLPHETVWGWKMLMQTGAYDDPAPVEQLAHKFQPANGPDEMRRLLRARFSSMLESANIEEVA